MLGADCQCQLRKKQGELSASPNQRLNQYLTGNLINITDSNGILASICYSFM